MKEGGEEVCPHQSHNNKNYLRIVDASGRERARRTMMMRIRAHEMLKIAVHAILSRRGSAGALQPGQEPQAQEQWCLERH